MAFPPWTWAAGTSAVRPIFLTVDALLISSALRVSRALPQYRFMQSASESSHARSRTEPFAT